MSESGPRPIAVSSRRRQRPAWLSRGRGRPLLALGVGLALVGAGLGGGWVWRHPNGLAAGGGTVTLYSPVGTPAVVGVAVPRAQAQKVMRIADVRQVRRRGDGDVVFLVCHDPLGGAVIGAVRGEAREHCATVEPARGALVGEGDQVVVQVSAESSASVVLDGFEVTYSQGWRHGTQRLSRVVAVQFGEQSVAEWVEAGASIDVLPTTPTR